MGVGLIDSAVVCIGNRAGILVCLGIIIASQFSYIGIVSYLISKLLLKP